MARPRKNRVGEYAKLLGEEIGRQLSREIAKTIADEQRDFGEEVAALRAEIRNLGRRIETFARRSKASKASIGRWVPGGPGRPPKDAADRIAAFESRAARPTSSPRAPARRPTPSPEPARRTLAGGSDRGRKLERSSSSDKGRSDP